MPNRRLSWTSREPTSTWRTNSIFGSPLNPPRCERFWLSTLPLFRWWSQPEGAEYLVEAHYSYRPRPWLSLGPNIQVIHHPGGQQSRSAVVVFGLKAGLAL